METTWDHNMKIEKENDYRFFQCVLAVWNVKFQFRLSPKPRELGPGTSKIVTSKQECRITYPLLIYSRHHLDGQAKRSENICMGIPWPITFPKIEFGIIFWVATLKYQEDDVFTKFSLAIRRSVNFYNFPYICPQIWLRVDEVRRKKRL